MTAADDSDYFGGVVLLEESAGGVAVPLEESAGGVVDGLL
jgi:hypothetical protein